MPSLLYTMVFDEELLGAVVDFSVPCLSRKSLSFSGGRNIVHLLHRCEGVLLVLNMQVEDGLGPRGLLPLLHL